MQIRITDNPISEDSKPTSNVEDAIVPTTLSNLQENGEDVIPVPNTTSSSSRQTSIWKEENYDAPKSEFSVEQ